MNKHLAWLALALTLGPSAVSVFAQETAPLPEQYEPPPPVGVDADLFVPPKNRMQVGLRMLSAPKISVSGQGSIIPLLAPVDFTSEGISRFYNDGNVQASRRTNSDGSSVTDGATNVWNYQNSSQVTSDLQHVQMHSYSADVDSTSLSGKGADSAGIEFTFERETGWHWGKLQINLIGGLSLNDIRFTKTQETSGKITTTTDTYAALASTLDATTNFQRANGPGQFTNVPAAPYSAPSTASDGTTDNTTLLEDVPDNHNVSDPTPAADGQLENQYKIHGAFFTFRFGPKFVMPITNKLQVNFSTGPALVYAGTTYTVNEHFTPDTGDASTTILSGEKNDVLPSYFADANLEYWLTERTGFYFGAAYQTSTNYHNTISDDTTNSRYTSTIDLTGQQGWRFGMDYKF